MGITFSLLLDNLFLIIIMALVIEVAVSSIFSISIIEELLQTSMTKSVKNILVILIAIGLCAKIPQLRIFFKAKFKIPQIIHLVLTALIMARFSNLFHSWFSAIKKKSQEMK